MKFQCVRLIRDPEVAANKAVSRRITFIVLRLMRIIQGIEVASVAGG